MKKGNSLKTFHIMYENQLIFVEFAEGYSYILKFPDNRFLMMDRNVSGWFIEDNGGNNWSEGDIQSLGALLELNEPPFTDEEHVDSIVKSLLLY